MAYMCQHGRIEGMCSVCSAEVDAVLNLAETKSLTTTDIRHLNGTQRDLLDTLVRLRALHGGEKVSTKR